MGYICLECRIEQHRKEEEEEEEGAFKNAWSIIIIKATIV